MDAAAGRDRPSPRIPRGAEITAEGLTVAVLSADSTARLRLEGELDASSAPTLVAVGRALADAGSAHMVLDCAGLRFCDSAGLHALASLRRLPGVGSVSVLRTSATLRRLLEITGLQKLFGTAA